MKLKVGFYPENVVIGTEYTVQTYSTKKSLYRRYSSIPVCLCITCSIFFDLLAAASCFSHDP